MTRYKFKGYTITNCGYHQPDHCVWWEAVNDNGEACFHGNTLREVEFMILDYEWEQKMKKKDEEIERLKREKILVCQMGMFNRDRLVKITAKAKAALSAPPRNCDVGTPEEQGNRMRQFCTKQKRNGIINCGYCPIKHEYQRDCTLEWAQMPYEAQEGGAR